MSSRYKITRRKCGFDVSGEDRNTVKVRLNEQQNGIVINPNETGEFSHEDNMSPLKLHAFYRMRDSIVTSLWAGIDFIAKQGLGKGKYKLRRMKMWAKQNTTKAITKRLHEEWKYLRLP